MSKLTKRLFPVVIFVLVLNLALTSCAPPTKPDPIFSGQVKIGVLADLSGDYAAGLRGIHRGVELAAENLVKQNIDIKLIIEDQKSCKPTETVTIMRKFVDVDNVDFVVGGTCSSTTLAAAPIANQAKVIMISPSSSAPSISDSGEYVFRTYISDAERAVQAAEWAYKQGFRRMAVLAETTNPAPVELGSAARKTFEKLGGIVVAKEDITQEKEYRTQLTKIKTANPDILVFSIGSGGVLGEAIKEAKELGITAQIIVPLESPEFPEVITIAQSAANDLVYFKPSAGVSTQEYLTLEAQYNNKFGESMPDYVLEAYDATMLGVKAILKSREKNELITNSLITVSKEYVGVSGNTTFDLNGDVHKPVQRKQIRNGFFVDYSS